MQVLVYPELVDGGECVYVAQGLEYDIVAQGASEKQAWDAFMLTLVGQVNLDLADGKRPLEGIDPAPQECWNRLENKE